MIGLKNMVGNMQFNDPNNCEDQPDNNEEEQEVVMEISNGDQEAEGEEEDDTSISEQEYAMLDKQLDDLNSVLDLLESKNDRIQAQLKALLENSREIRQSLAEENTSTENKTSESSPQN